MDTYAITISDPALMPPSQCEVVVDHHNARIKLLDLTAEHARATGLPGPHPESEGCSKLTVYASDSDLGPWQQMGLRHEATIEGYFSDGSAAVIVARYTDQERARDAQALAHDAAVSACTGLEVRNGKLPEDWTSRVATEADAPALSEILRATFPDYPSPIDPDSIRQQIRTKSHHFRLLFTPDGQLAAAASLELDLKRKSAELTDCATRPEHRGRGLMTAMLQQLETDAVEIHGIRDLYTIARANQPGINRAFARRGFRYTGRLINNCRMPAGWESMNVWCKRASVR